MKQVKIILVAGARPNFMKIAPLMEAMEACPSITPLLVHTGQHYDEKMSDLFFRQLGIPEPSVNLGIGGGGHAVQTAEIMKAFEQVVLAEQPDAVLVVGDVNSTIACGLVAVKLGIKLIHVEAGLRSGDRTMPEEINRLLTDTISDMLFCTETSGVENLAREGVAEDKVFLVGNVMIDTLLKNRDKAEASGILDEMGLESGNYAVLTLHRPSNVDNAETFSGLLDVVDVVQQRMPVVFPIHPRTRNNLPKLGLAERAEAMAGLRMIEPIGYLDFLKLTSSARIVLTDSGGIQEETTILKVPCLTLRESTERPITAEVGSNRIVGTNPADIIPAFEQLMSGESRQPEIPPLWDGQAAQRIVEILSNKLR
jgi:UDP-N-acetylglucosamine 2-epimerase (non-hydrolysing)